MLKTTYDAVQAILKSDPSITAVERNRILNTLRGKPSKASSIYSSPPEARLLRRREVAGRLGVSVRTIDKLAASGVLNKKRLPGRVRHAGFLETDVVQLLTEKEAQ